MFCIMSFHCQFSDQGVIERASLIEPARDTHKYSRGHAMVASGPPMRTGASRLSAQAALAVGAGLVTLFGEADALREHAAHVTAIMLREADAALSIIDERVRAVAIGPGAGVSEATRAAVVRLLLFRLPLVLDADAITAFADVPDRLFAALHDQVVLTPHEGEFARIFPDIDLNNRTAAVKVAAARAGATILLKGPETMIAAADGRFAINRHASPWLATAGSGDVLAGLITGLLAQGNSAFEAACVGAWLHGDIGERGGPGLTADRMVDLIPLVLAGCLSKGEGHDTGPCT
jgi:ADP-dependent NAD(P)H-hydrate dehydratase / NAD(P)H-hydrate epimerase